MSLFGKIINAEWLNSQLPITNTARHSSIYCLYKYKTSVINIRYVIKWLYKQKTTTFHYWRVINNALSIIILHGYHQLHLFWTKRTHTLFRRSNTPMISILIDMNLLLISIIELHRIIHNFSDNLYSDVLVQNYKSLSLFLCRSIAYPL